jgi:endonuclease YncB( thermonuclease family)
VTGLLTLAPLTTTYAATVVKVLDGDTFHADMVIGKGDFLGTEVAMVAMDTSIRLYGVNAWEKNTEAGKAARENMRQVLPPGTRLTLSRVRKGKFGRTVAQVTMPDGSDLAATLIAEQWAAKWNGIGKAPLPAWPRA